MARFKSTNTRPELVLRQGLQAAGLSGYRLHMRNIQGRPDVAFTRWKVAVFVDGGYWHGHPDVFQFGTKGTYWDEKISRNQERDRSTNLILERSGWTVMRFWDFEVLRELDRVVAEIYQTLTKRGRFNAGVCRSSPVLHPD